RAPGGRFESRQAGYAKPDSPRELARPDGRPHQVATIPARGEAMTTRDTRVRTREVEMESIRDRFGGADLVAGLLGMFTALGVLVFLGSLIMAGNAGLEYQLNQVDLDGNLQEVEVVGAIVGILAVLAAFF